MGVLSNPAKITTSQIDQYILHLRKQGNANGTINRKLATVSKMLSHAKKRGWVTSTPTIERLPEAEHRVRYLSLEEEQTIIHYFEEQLDQDMVDLVQFLVDTGLRAGEAFELTHDQVQDGRIYLAGINTKSGKNRMVPPTERAAGILEARKHHDPVFGASITYWVANRRWNDMKEALGLQDDSQLVIHALRHTFATRCISAGASVPDVQKLMGHATIEMTMRYSHVSNESLESAISKLGQLSRKSVLQSCDRSVTGTVTKLQIMGHHERTQVLI